MTENISHVHVLSTGFEQLYTTSWQHAISIVFGGRAEVVEEHPFATIGCVDGSIPMPTSIRFKKGVFAGAIRHPQREYRPNRKNLFVRDKGTCQYCGKHLVYEKSTIDHVIPKSRGGQDCWDNLVLSCESCNNKKGCKLPAEAGLTLSRNPQKPD